MAIYVYNYMHKFNIKGRWIHIKQGNIIKFKDGSIVPYHVILRHNGFDY